MKVNIITDVGKIYLQNSITNNTPLKISSIKVGSGIVANLEEAKLLTGIKELKKNLGVLTVEKVSTDVLVKTPFNNIGNPAGYNLREVGIYVQNPDLTESLFWYINYDAESNFINAEDLGVINVDLAFRLVFSNENITVTNTNSLDIFVTKAYLDQKIAEVVGGDLSDKLSKSQGGVVEKKVAFNEGINITSINDLPYPLYKEFEINVIRDENLPATEYVSDRNLKITPYRPDLNQEYVDNFKDLDIYPFNQIGRVMVPKISNGKDILYEFEDEKTDLELAGFDPLEHDIVVRIPSFYAKRNWDGTLKKNSLLLNKIPKVPKYKRYEVPPAFLDVDGSVMPYILVGFAKGCVKDGMLRSIPNELPIVNLNMNQARTYARTNRDSCYDIESIHDISVVQFLYEIAFQDTNSQNIIGNGWTNKTDKTVTGATMLMGNRSGCLVNGNQISLFGIEDYYGNVWSLVDGAVIKDNGIFYTMNNNDWGDSTKYNIHIPFTPPMGVNAGEQQNGYVKNMQQIDGFISYPKEVTGSSSGTYYTDYHWSHPRGQTNIFLFGTSWASGAHSGVWYWYCYWSFTDALSSVGCRVVIKPRKPIV